MRRDIRNIRKRESSCSIDKKKARFKASAKIRAAGVIAACAAALMTACGGKKSSVDLDLSSMSGNVVYAQVFNIMMSPEEYVGKTIRMSGSLAVEHDLVHNKVYTSCIIQDATACCAQGIEFDWKGDHEYPDDYPELDSEIEVSGVFSRIEDETGEYYVVTDATMERL